MPELDSLDVIFRLGLAGVLGGAIGMERELRERHWRTRRRSALDLQGTQNPAELHLIRPEGGGRGGR